VRLFANVGMGITLLSFRAFATPMIATPVWAVVAGLMLMSPGCRCSAPRTRHRS
jgi:hypothetical protein